MELSELTSGEVVALVILVKHLIRADDHVSDTEIGDLMQLGQAVGMTKFSAALAQTKDVYKRRDDVMQMAGIVTNPESRQLVYNVLEQVAGADGLHTNEDDILAELRLMWGFGAP